MTASPHDARLNEQRRFPIRLPRLRWWILATVMLVVGFVVFQVYELLFETIPDLYAQEWVAGMVIDYMETHGGRWPHDWDDLREPYESATLKSGRPWSFEELRGRVEVDFAADPSVLAKPPLEGDEPPFRVIRLRSGKRHHWEGMEPNSMIWRYFKEQAKVPEPDEPLLQRSE